MLFEPCHNRATAIQGARHFNGLMAGKVAFATSKPIRVGYRGDQWAYGSEPALQLAGFVVLEKI